MNLRQAKTDDLPAVSALLEAQRLPLDGVADSIRDYIIAEEKGAVAGTIGLERYERYGLLRSAAVATGWQGKGVGQLLVERLLETAKACGLTDVYLFTTTAERYFPRYGFKVIPREAVPEPVQRSVEFTSACPSSATVMVREIA
ncbi:MAG TPA: arsenic resistance N-acetyltransferase ArsN2 [Gemmatimonadales bacterium]|jgi:amino-acid N-acetyltransferase